MFQITKRCGKDDTLPWRNYALKRTQIYFTSEFLNKWFSGKRTKWWFSWTRWIWYSTRTPISLGHNFWSSLSSSDVHQHNSLLADGEGCCQKWEERKRHILPCVLPLLHSSCGICINHWRQAGRKIIKFPSVKCL